MNIECVIRHKKVENRHTAHVDGRGRDYLCSLSEQLSALHARVNAALTELVNNEKGGANVAASLEADSDHDQEDDDEDADMTPEPKKAKK